MLNINTRYGCMNNIPDTNWTELEPFWPTIATSMIEVMYENKFRPYPATESAPDGVVSSPYYWQKYKKRLPFSQAIRFLELLKLKQEFVNVVKIFNKGYVDWIKDENISILGSKVYGFYYTLSPALSIYEDNEGIWIRIAFA
jgi:hypothetical protein